ncbi:ATP phosphoribosyltransferase regulatory subunit [Tranquillimonas rosea]|uniref:Histidine--tRNA ligase n=1 Tax=Tranquillimonas rosea TaxID=641238 RepID=A0A1H9S8F3_9RHOB|nr:ATP phosphoribosyltransferase regulatory subunit [Tranquillimonas rosea]SER80663.1 ATP phosphoribosyltransferase regulatory subunit [Tranquillimonas rosea]
MAEKSASLAEALRHRAAFETLGAQVVEADILQPADVLLDLYGEDIRGRAFTTTDPIRGEQMLRPDFTVPVVQMHMSGRVTPARYTYAGEVFRRQERDPSRPPEYMQVGFEIFGGEDPAAADAEVFTAIADRVAPLGLGASTGDYGILIAAVRGLSTTEARKAALLRHIWRPRRFRQLLDRFGGKTPRSEERLALLNNADPLADAGPEIGLRRRADVMARIEALRADAAEPPLGAGEVELLDTILDLRETAPNVLANLRDIAVDLPAIDDAVDRLDARLSALDAAGVDVETLPFEASYARTAMEYYDGFVFGFSAPGRPDLPPVATGGRYDALTRILGGGRASPAVGGVIRPDLVLSLGEGAA